jgi:uncharacterized protein YukE
MQIAALSIRARVQPGKTRKNMVNTYQLRSTIDALYSGAGALTQAANQLRGTTKQLAVAAQGLVSGVANWKGQAAQSFSMKWNQYQSDSQRVANDLDTIAPILRTLAEGLEAALFFAQELERLDPLTALARLGVYVAHPLAQALEYMMVEEAIQMMLNEAVMEADKIAAASLSGVVLEDIAQFSVSPEYRWLQDAAGRVGTMVGDITPIAEQVVDHARGLEKAAPLVEKAGPLLDILGLGVEIYSEKKHDPYTMSIDVGGFVIGEAVGLTGVGTAVEVVAAGVQLLSLGDSWMQGQIAQRYTGTTRELLEDPAKNLELTADNADITKVFNDLAKLIIDSHGTVLSPTLFPIVEGADLLSRVFGVQDPLSPSTPTMRSDEGQLLADTGRLVLSPVQLIVNSEAANYDDRLVNANAEIQNLPLPSSIKQVSSHLTPIVIRSINDVADFVTKPDEIERIGTNVWNSITTHW